MQTVRPYTEQECQESLIQRKIRNQQKFEQRPQTFLRLSFTELCDSKLLVIRVQKSNHKK